MEVVIFDVGNASCNYICSPNKYAMMIDCGASNEKPNPVDFILGWKHWDSEVLKAKPYCTASGKCYPLALLHITHPDDDHVRNAERICNELTPYLMRHKYAENYDDADGINELYRRKLDSEYRGKNPEVIDWGFDKNEEFSIPISIVKSDPCLKSKVRNNSVNFPFLGQSSIRLRI